VTQPNNSAAAPAAPATTTRPVTPVQPPATGRGRQPVALRRPRNQNNGGGGGGFKKVLLITLVLSLIGLVVGFVFLRRRAQNEGF